MEIRFIRPTVKFALAAALSFVTLAAASAQRGPVEHIRGAVTAVDATTLTVRARDGGSVTIALPEKLRVSGLVRAKLSSVRKGSYIGTAAVPGPGGILVAQELLIFPKKMRGVGEGHRKWDLTPDSTMTNANVTSVIDQVKGRVLSLQYKGGQKDILVPRDAPVVTIVRGDRKMLVTGANVFVVAHKSGDGKLSAIRIAIGKDGLVPPM